MITQFNSFIMDFDTEHSNGYAVDIEADLSDEIQKHARDQIFVAACHYRRLKTIQQLITKYQFKPSLQEFAQGMRHLVQDTHGHKERAIEIFHYCAKEMDFSVYGDCDLLYHNRYPELVKSIWDAFGYTRRSRVWVPDLFGSSDPEKSAQFQPESLRIQLVDALLEAGWKPDYYKIDEAIRYYPKDPVTEKTFQSLSGYDRTNLMNGVMLSIYTKLRCGGDFHILFQAVVWLYQHGVHISKDGVDAIAKISWSDSMDELQRDIEPEKLSARISGNTQNRIYQKECLQQLIEAGYPSTQAMQNVLSTS